MSAYSDEILAEAGLVAYWRMNEASGTNLADSKGTNTGTINGTPTMGVAGAIAGDTDKALQFDGTNDYVNVPDVAALDLGDGPFSLEFWIKFAANETQTGWILHKGSGGYGVRYSGTGKTIFFTKSSTDIVQTSVQVSATDTWKHVVITKNGATTILYVDGVNRTGTVTNQTIINTASPLRIGSEQTPASFLKATLDEVAVYNAVLSAADVLSHYEIGSQVAPQTPRYFARKGARKNPAKLLGQFGARSGPQGMWRPYAADSPVNKPIPPSPTIHANSAAMVAKLAAWINSDGVTGAPNELRPGVAASTAATDSDHPVYYSRSDDPLFTILQRTDGFTSDYWGTQIRIPQDAKHPDGLDRHMTVVDFSTGNEWGWYKTAANAAGATLPALPAGGGTFYARGFGKNSIYGTGLNLGVGDSTALRWGNLAGIIRYEELITRNIAHALFMMVKSTDGTYVYPATGAAGASDPTNAPPCGARFQLNMTVAEIDALSTTWYNKVLLKAMARYGFYVADTSGSHSWYVTLESGFSYTSFGLADPWYAFGKAYDGDGAMFYSGTDDHSFWNYNVVDWATKLRVLDWTDSANR